MVYKGPYLENEIRNFVVEVANNVQKKQQFSKEKVKEETPGGIPAYCIGHPLCGNDKVCYLTFNGAYQPGQGGSGMAPQQGAPQGMRSQ